MQTVPIKVSNALQSIYHEIDSQLIFLNFKAAHARFSLYAKAVLMSPIHRCNVSTTISVGQRHTVEER